MARHEISVIIPVKDEEENINELTHRLTAALVRISKKFEIIYVTDVNRDKTFELLCQQSRKDKRIKVIKLTRSLGQHIALLGGLNNCSGNYTVLMDGDLQDYPEDIHLLYKKAREGYDIVYALKKNKNKNFIRNLFSKIFNFIMQAFSNIKYDVNSSIFRIISRKAMNELLKFREIEPSITYIFGYINLPT